ncbi:MAG: hypothetical protein KUL88_14145 [Rhizobium sp.]|nr:hypothetical protein [Rhizobium sp.]
MSIENDIIGDRVFAPLVSATLRELADMIDAGEAGCLESEIYRREDGTVAVISSRDVIGGSVPYRKPDTQYLPSCYSQDEA